MKLSVLMRITGQAIAACVLKELEELGLDVANCRSQGCDGESNMSIVHVLGCRL